MTVKDVSNIDVSNIDVSNIDEFKFIEIDDNNQIFCKKSLIDYELVKDMLGLASLVYNFNIDIKAEISENTKKFDLNNLKIDKLSVDIEKRMILNDILSNSPNAELYKFYDLESGTQAGVTVSHKEKRITFIFRGSNELIDWVHDLLICKRELPNGTYVHLGFYKSLFSCDLYYKLKNDFISLTNEYQDYNIYITGHSLGGGLATLFSYFLSEITEQNLTVITFASPRVGNKNWADDFNSRSNLRHYRFVNKRDIVTAIPYIYFKHVGNCIELNNKELKYCDFNLYKDIQNILKYFNPFDHFIENYYTNLLKCKWNKDSCHCKLYDSILKSNIQVELKEDLDKK
tara:strand:+ start:3509 stop:4540 length:1032 start_codon:yes stop_codon:yes gene_type:complete